MATKKKRKVPYAHITDTNQKAKEKFARLEREKRHKENIYNKLMEAYNKQMQARTLANLDTSSVDNYLQENLNNTSTQEIGNV